MAVIPKWKQCADLAEKGLNPKEIGFKLGLKPKTVEYHLAIAKKKMHLNGWGQTPFLLAVIERQQVERMDKRLVAIEEHLKLALDILMRVCGK